MSIVHTLSAALAYVIVVGSSLLKLPQLYNILRSRSADGISLTSLLLEAAGYSIVTSWGIARELDFKDFGEGMIITVQLFILIVLVGHYQGRAVTLIAVYLPILVAGGVLASGIVSRGIHEGLLSVQIILGLVARVPQIHSNHTRRDTGELAFLTFFLAFGGCAARFLTTSINVSWEKGKAMLMVQFAFAAFLNFVIVAQIVWYMYIKGPRGARTRMLLAKYGIQVPANDRVV